MKYSMMIFLLALPAFAEENRVVDCRSQDSSALSSLQILLPEGQPGTENDDLRVAKKYDLVIALNLPSETFEPQKYTVVRKGSRDQGPGSLTRFYSKAISLVLYTGDGRDANGQVKGHLNAVIESKSGAKQNIASDVICKLFE